MKIKSAFLFLIFLLATLQSHADWLQDAQRFLRSRFLSKAERIVCTAEPMRAIEAARVAGLAAYNRRRADVLEQLTKPREIEIFNCLGRRLAEPVKAKCILEPYYKTANTIGAQIEDARGASVTYYEGFFINVRKNLNESNGRVRWEDVREPRSLETQTFTYVHEMAHQCEATDGPYWTFDNEADYYANWVMNEDMNVEYDP